MISAKRIIAVLSAAVLYTALPARYTAAFSVESSAYAAAASADPYSESFELNPIPAYEFSALEYFQITWSGPGKPNSVTTDNPEVEAVLFSDYIGVYISDNCNIGGDEPIVVNLWISNRNYASPLTIYIAPTIVEESAKISLCAPGEEELFVGNSFQLEGYVTKYAGMTIEWSSDNPDVASVDSTGLITINGFGTVTVTAEFAGGYDISDSVTFIVAKSTVYGDIDGDGEVKMSDVIRVMCHASNPEKYPFTEEQKKNGDVYQQGDGVDTSDALSIQKYVAQIIQALPEA